MPPKEKKKGRSKGMSKKARERKEKKLLEERINNSKQKCEEARAFLEPTGKHAEPNYTKAKEALEAAIEFYDAHALPFFLMGECYRAQGELTEAIEYYSRALDANPLNTPALEARALCYQNLNDVAHAIEDYTSMIELEPENDHAYNMRGVCLASVRVPGLRLKLIDFKRCEGDLKTAARLNEANYHALANLGKLYEDQGELEKALPCYTASLQVKESYTYARFRRGCTALRLAEKTFVKDDDGDDDDSSPPGDGAASNGGGHSTKPAAVSMAEVEREALETMQEEEALEKAKKTVRDAEADFTALLEGNPVADKNLADVNVVLNLGVCAMLLEDFNKADDYFALAEQIIGARPAMVGAGEALPIENVEQIQKVLELRKNVLRRKKLERAQASV